MSAPAQAQIAILVPSGGRSHSWTPPAAPRTRPAVTLASFGTLALYGALSWDRLLSDSAGGRLAGLVVLALALAAAGPWLRRRSRFLPPAALAAAALLMLAICGVPLGWLVHLRIAVSARWIGRALSELPQVVVPYGGGDRWVRVVILLGPAVLLLAAVSPLAFTHRPLRARARVAAALPLLVLAAVPSTLLRPAHPYLEGLLLFALLVGLLAGDRVPRPAAPLAAILAAAAAAGAMVLAPGLDTRRPWVDFQALAGRLSAGQVEQFDFAQGFGPLQWPRTGREVFDVRAAHPDYWKVEDLDLFDGRGFVPGLAPSAPLPTPDAAALRRFTQTLTVSIRSLQSSEVIAAGSAGPPAHVTGVAQPGLAPGTWNVSVPLRPGDSYSVHTYSPQPTAAELAGAGNDYPALALAPYRSMLLPSGGYGGSTAVVFEPFHQGPELGLAGSAYEQAYTLAQRLAARAPTPYAFVQSVMAWLHRGYAYDERPPPAAFPLVSFLFDTRRGYCQQFAGAMALLLRMGGLPARVVGGFTPGVLDSASHQWVVTDLDAHDWVEVWFPHFGWVRFDPTPGSAPARSGAALPPGLRARPDHPAPTFPRARHRTAPAPRDGGRALAASPPHASGGALSPALLALIVLLVAGGAAAVALRVRGGTGIGLVEELERALQRTGRPAAGGVTLTALERRLRHNPDAAAYVRCLRARRYAAAPATPTPRQRRALRAALRDGLGPLGRLRALWALPPRRAPRS